jgi:hypothetical protein
LFRGFLKIIQKSIPKYILEEYFDIEYFFCFTLNPSPKERDFNGLSFNFQ